MKFLPFLVCLLSLGCIEANEMNQPSFKTFHTQQEDNVEDLAHIGKSYVELLNRIGAEQNLSHEKEVKSLCATTCKKIVNGSVWFENVDSFIPQLLSTGEKVGFWSIEPLDIIPGKDERTVVVRFLVHTEKAGIWNTLVILRCNDKLLITEINEIFNSYEGAS